MSQEEPMFDIVVCYDEEGRPYKLPRFLGGSTRGPGWADMVLHECPVCGGHYDPGWLDRERAGLAKAMAKFGGEG